MVLKLLAAIFNHVKPENKDNTADKRVRDEEIQMKKRDEEIYIYRLYNMSTWIKLALKPGMPGL